jgi:hypothetical protein
MLYAGAGKQCGISSQLDGVTRLKRCGTGGLTHKAGLQHRTADLPGAFKARFGKLPPGAGINLLSVSNWPFFKVETKHSLLLCLHFLHALV